MWWLNIKAFLIVQSRTVLLYHIILMKQFSSCGRITPPAYRSVLYQLYLQYDIWSAGLQTKDEYWKKGSASGIAQPKQGKGIVYPGHYPQVTVEQLE